MAANLFRFPFSVKNSPLVRLVYLGFMARIKMKAV